MVYKFRNGCRGDIFDDGEGGQEQNGSGLIGGVVTSGGRAWNGHVGGRDHQTLRVCC